MVQIKIDVTEICRMLNLFACYFTEQLAACSSILLTSTKLGEFHFFNLPGGNVRNSSPASIIGVSVIPLNENGADVPRLRSTRYRND